MRREAGTGGDDCAVMWAAVALARELVHAVGDGTVRRRLEELPLRAGHLRVALSVCCHAGFSFGFPLSPSSPTRNRQEMPCTLWYYAPRLSVSTSSHARASSSAPAISREWTTPSRGYGDSHVTQNGLRKKTIVTIGASAGLLLACVCGGSAPRPRGAPITTHGRGYNTHTDNGHGQPGN
jgi:hypothetical protein